MTATILPSADASEMLETLVGRELDEDQLAEVHARATWSCLVEPGDGIAGLLVEELGATGALRAVEEERAVAAERAGISPRQWHDALARWRPRLETAPATEALRAAAHASARLLTPEDPRWPARLADLGAHAPLCLWYRGDAAHLGAPAQAVAIVGARAATGYGEHVAMELSADLAARGVTIVSGAAYGIDGAAHRAALHAGRPTVALLAGGVDRPYPAGNASLIDRIAACGAVASEVPCGSTPTKWRFLQRNRAIAALSDATVVVEAGWRSGSLNTAGHAATLGRPLGAVPGPVTSAASAGTHRLLRDYDARCITRADDVMELIGGDRQRPDPGMDVDDRTDDRTRLLDALSVRSARPVDELARRSGMSPADVEAIIGVMRLEGVVVETATGWRRLTSTER